VRGDEEGVPERGGGALRTGRSCDYSQPQHCTSCELAHVCMPLDRAAGFLTGAPPQSEAIGGGGTRVAERWLGVQQMFSSALGCCVQEVSRGFAAAVTRVRLKSLAR